MNATKNYGKRIGTALKLACAILSVLLLGQLFCSCADSEKKTAEDLAKRLEGREFIFCSGAGGWQTTLTFGKDLSFTGNYVDSDLGLQDEEGIDGTVFVCNFHGSFTDVKKLGDLKYRVSLKELVSETEKDKVWYGEENGNRYKYVGSYPYGISGGNEFEIYLPGIASADVDENFILGLVGFSYMAEYSEYPLPFYGLYSADPYAGFFSHVTKDSGEGTTK